MSPTEEIKSKIDIVEFLKEYIEVRPAGKNMKARCPLHNEKTPSFMISPERQTWRCFGCSRGGDIFTFVMEHEHCEFYEALTMLAEKTGVAIRRYASGEQRQLNVLFDINEAAAEFFSAALPTSTHAQTYLASRGLHAKTCEEFMLGITPPASSEHAGGDAAIRHLTGKGFAMNDIVRAGIAMPGRRGGYNDRFYDRLMFPIHNHFGKIIGFTGRILHENPAAAKYLNTPETPVFKKSKILYGFHRSKEHIRNERSAFLVEGQMDFLMAWQDGVKTGIATSGTAVTQDHLLVLRRYADKLVVSFDNDDAGWAASERVLSMAHALDFTTYVVLLSESVNDPADIVVKNPGMLKAMIHDAQPAIRLLFEKYPVTDNPIESKVNIRMLLKTIHVFTSAIDRGYWMRELSRTSGVPEEELKEEMSVIAKQSDKKAATLSASASVPTVNAPPPMTRLERISEHLISTAVAHNKIHELKKSASLQYVPKKYQEIIIALAEDNGTDGALHPPITLIQERAGLEEHGTIEELETQLLTEYESMWGDLILQEIRRAEAQHDEKKVDLLMQKMNRLKSESPHARGKDAGTRTAQSN